MSCRLPPNNKDCCSSCFGFFFGGIVDYRLIRYTANSKQVDLSLANSNIQICGGWDEHINTSND
jgi:hypothetical protein